MTKSSSILLSVLLLGGCAQRNQIATAAGMDPKKYGSGEGPASEWREW